MAGSLTEPAVRASRPSTPESIDADLAGLWRGLAQGDAPVARAVMSNLVVVRARSVAADTGVETMTAGLPLDGVVARHPSRLIVLEHEHPRDGPGAPFAAAVGIVVFGPPHARYGVEQIVVRSACAEAALPSIVHGLIRGDLPTTVWWTEDLSELPPLEALITMGRQLIYDSRTWRDIRAGVRALAPIVAANRVDLADVNWRRLAPLRRALGLAPGGRAAAASLAGAQVRVAYRDNEAALAWLLAGWLIAAREHTAGAAPPEIAPSTSEDAVLSVEIRRGSTALTATLTSRSVVVSEGAAAPLIVGVQVEGEADALAAELGTLSQDTALHAAMAALARHFGPR